MSDKPEARQVVLSYADPLLKEPFMVPLIGEHIYYTQQLAPLALMGARNCIVIADTKEQADDMVEKAGKISQVDCFLANTHKLSCQPLDADQAMDHLCYWDRAGLLLLSEGSTPNTARLFFYKPLAQYGRTNIFTMILHHSITQMISNGLKGQNDVSSVLSCVRPGREETLQSGRKALIFDVPREP